jgi:AraC family transcriptional regulator, transcriptional activator of pobA
MRNTSPPEIISSISEQHRRLGIPAPRHPLVSVYRFEDLPPENLISIHHFSLNFYCIAIKKNFKGKLKYGQRYYDFDEGVMSFISPQQVLSLEEGESATEGWSLSFHPDLIAGTPLANKIKSFGFFSYSLSEALHLSDKEEETVESLIRSIEQELETSIDHLSHDIIVSQLELLLNYSNRFYKRQFITRAVSEHEVLINLERLLSKLFESEELDGKGVPTVHDVAAQMNLSPGYLSDMLRTLTGQNTQQHIHNKLIEKAKEKLSTTSLSVSEIAYQLGFEHPQSLNKLFKSKTKLSPLEYRRSMN